MKLLPVLSKDQLADFFTKPLIHQLFHLLLSKLEILDIYHVPACGGLLENEGRKEDSTSEIT
jgi:hypothetical protein